MPEPQKTSATKLWLKQLTTGTFRSFNEKVDRIAFFRNNKKALGFVLVGWCLTLFICFFFLDSFGVRQKEAFFLRHAVAAEALANQSAPILLEDDLLGLNREVADFSKTYKVIFATVLNHERKVVAHTDAERFNQPYQDLEAAEQMQVLNEVVVQSGVMADGLDTITFTQNITYSGVKIGSAVFGVPKKRITDIDSRTRLYKLLAFASTLFIVAAMVLWLSRRKTSVSPKHLSISADGSIIGPYRLKDKIAQGGMAELYIADYVREDGFKRKVAIKKVLPHLVENQDFINMFVREARLAALLQHPNIVQIFDFGKIQRTYFIAMEYIDGLNLGQIMAKLKAPLPVDMAIFIVMKISLGLHYSHTRKDDDTGRSLGIVHRDISPQNILISNQGEVKISDFGISKATTEPSLTQAGVIKGKLAYLAPEQALGKEVDHQADIYALGLVFYEILSGRRLYHFDSDIQAIRTIPEMVIPPIVSVRPEVPDALNRIVMQCLEKDKTRRYADAMSLHNDLRKLRARLQMSYGESDLSNFIRTLMKNA